MDVARGQQKHLGVLSHAPFRCLPAATLSSTLSSNMSLALSHPALVSPHPSYVWPLYLAYAFEWCPALAWIYVYLCLALPPGVDTTFSLPWVPLRGGVSTTAGQFL